jgi:hypothetical protein
MFPIANDDFFHQLLRLRRWWRAVFFACVGNEVPLVSVKHMVAHYVAVHAFFHQNGNGQVVRRR